MNLHERSCSCSVTHTSSGYPNTLLERMAIFSSGLQTIQTRSAKKVWPHLRGIGNSKTGSESKPPLVERMHLAFMFQRKEGRQSNDGSFLKALDIFSPHGSDCQAEIKNGLGKCLLAYNMIVM